MIMLNYHQDNTPGGKSQGVRTWCITYSDAEHARFVITLRCTEQEFRQRVEQMEAAGCSILEVHTHV
jgi:hypothetical protein